MPIEEVRIHTMRSEYTYELHAYDKNGGRVGKVIGVKDPSSEVQNVKFVRDGKVIREDTYQPEQTYFPYHWAQREARRVFDPAPQYTFNDVEAAVEKYREEGKKVNCVKNSAGCDYIMTQEVVAYLQYGPDEMLATIQRHGGRRYRNNMTVRDLNFLIQKMFEMDEQISENGHLPLLYY